MFRKKGDQSWLTLAEVAEYANTPTLMEMVTTGKTYTSNQQPHYISPPMEFWFNSNNPDSASSIFLSCAMLLLTIFHLF